MGLLEDYPVCLDISVAWGEMDAFQHVNNAVYFRYFEDVRMVLLDRLGILVHMEQEGVGPILAHTQCDYKVPLVYPDQVTVGVQLRELGRDRFLTRYRIVSHKLQRVAAEGDGLIVYYDYRATRKCTVPDVIRARMLELDPAAEAGAG